MREKTGLTNALLDDSYKPEINVVESNETKRVWRFDFIWHLGAGICWQHNRGLLTISILFLNISSYRVPKRKRVTVKYVQRGDI